MIMICKILTENMSFFEQKLNFDEVLNHNGGYSLM